MLNFLRVASSRFSKNIYWRTYLAKHVRLRLFCYTVCSRSRSSSYGALCLTSHWRPFTLPMGAPSASLWGCLSPPYGGASPLYMGALHIGGASPLYWGSPLYTHKCHWLFCSFPSSYGSHHYFFEFFLINTSHHAWYIFQNMQRSQIS